MKRSPIARSARGSAEQLSMTDPGRQPTPVDQANMRMVCALVAVLIVGCVARCMVTLIPPLVVGDDGAYYLVQVRAILRGGALAFPDFPLLFYVQACVARVLLLVMEQRAAIVAAVRITDTVLPLALAVPVFLFARAFVRRVTAPLEALSRWRSSASWPSRRATRCSWPGA